MNRGGMLHGMPGTSAQEALSFWRLPGGPRRFFDLNNPRQPDRKRRAAAGLALDRNIAPHQLAEAFADREAKAGPAVLRVVDASACENS